MSFDSIHNYYEQLVVERIRQNVAPQEGDEDFLQDVACVALNQLPARYVHHNVDLLFYMSGAERARMEQDVENAVAMAVEYVTKHRASKRPETFTQ